MVLSGRPRRREWPTHLAAARLAAAATAAHKKVVGWKGESVGWEEGRALVTAVAEWASAMVAATARVMAAAAATEVVEAIEVSDTA